MILTVYTDDAEYNAELRMAAYRLKALTTRPEFLFASHGKHSVVDSHQTDRPLSMLGVSEPLYIMGHHIEYEDGRETLSDQEPAQLYETLMGCGLNPFQKNIQIILICCRSGLRTDFLSRSFAENLRECFFERIGEFDWHHRVKEGSTPKISAPDKLISVAYDNLWVIEHEDYPTFQELEEAAEKRRWVEEHSRPAKASDFRFFPFDFKYHICPTVLTNSEEPFSLGIAP